MTAWAEGRAPWRHDPSADPGAKTEGGRHDAALSFPFGIGTNAPNRPGLFRCAFRLILRLQLVHFTLSPLHDQWGIAVPVPHREKRNGTVPSASSRCVTEWGPAALGFDFDGVHTEITTEQAPSLLGFQAWR